MKNKLYLEIFDDNINTNENLALALNGNLNEPKSFDKEIYEFLNKHKGIKNIIINFDNNTSKKYSLK